VKTRAEIVEHPNGTFDFRIIADENGDILAFSHQGYARRADAMNTLSRVTNIGTVPITFTKE
jgi:uncharacterized protein YegP (UPF0339 family)